MNRKERRTAARAARKQGISAEDAAALTEVAKAAPEFDAVMGQLKAALMIQKNFREYLRNAYARAAAAARLALKKLQAKAAEWCLL